MKKNIIIKTLDHEGKGIGNIDGKIIFVPNTLPNEEVSVEITKEKTNYLEGEVSEILKPSSLRVKSVCPYYNKCGGCSYMHVNLNDEESIKTNIVKNIFKKYANLEINPTFISSKEYNYRNKIELKIENNNWGYYNASSHDFIKIDNCLIAKDSINKLIKNKDLFNIKNGEIIIRSNYNDELLIKINTEDNYNIDIDRLKNNHKIIGIIVNNKLIYGEDYFYERVGGYIFKVNINSFFQVNLDILNEVFNIIKKGNLGNVVDLYCGVGTLGIAVNKDKLYGIEIIPEAIKDAIKNAKINNQNNIYMLGDSSNIKEINDEINTIIIDPPRSGLNKQTLDNILKINPEIIIYMSCNPITLARDMFEIKQKYDIHNCYILNMFPRTKHIETVCLLNRKNP